MKRIVFLDYLRVIAIFMVIVVHACENFYLGGDGLLIRSVADGYWSVFVDSAVRASVPLFVMTSAYLLFPVTKPTGAFLSHRILRVGVPFAFWACVYNLWNGGEWLKMLFNFPAATGGHLWFVPMLLGLYLVMPLLSPWAERVTKKELQGWILLWFFTTTFPFLRWFWGVLNGSVWAHLMGEANFDNIPFLFGECGWNLFGTFHYVSGFVGYMLVGFYIRKFLPELTWKRTLSVALPLWSVGYLIVALPFYLRTSFPAAANYAKAVDLEMSWEFCSTGVAMTAIAYFLVVRKFVWEGAFYKILIAPLSRASYGIYLIHILILVPIVTYLDGRVPTGLAIFGAAAATFALSALASLFLNPYKLIRRNKK